ncbi:MAG: pirin family protein [Bdellovibrionaceae bacterium]|nr:pirin family protein [Pseudobdellovibrionaceae bacterium]
MIKIRRSHERGLAEHGWLKSRHTFSFAEYYDPEHMGFGPLRVINEDWIAAATGFNTHPHKDMEIITYVVSGRLRHKDSMGNVAIIRPGEVQHMSAGTGILHSEHNDMQDQETHLFQIWILPDQRGIQPGYGQKSFENELNTKKLVHVISKEGRDGSISLHQDADIYISRLKKSEGLSFKISPGRRLWIQLIKGAVDINGEKIEAGDAFAAEQILTAEISSTEDSEMILFDLP